MEVEIGKLELFMTTGDLLLRCIDVLDKAPNLSSTERKEAERLQMPAAQVLDVWVLDKNHAAA